MMVHRTLYHLLSHEVKKRAFFDIVLSETLCVSQAWSEPAQNVALAPLVQPTSYLGCH